MEISVAVTTLHHLRFSGEGVGDGRRF